MTYFELEDVLLAHGFRRGEIRNNEEGIRGYYRKGWYVEFFKCYGVTEKVVFENGYITACFGLYDISYNEEAETIEANECFSFCLKE